MIEQAAREKSVRSDGERLRAALVRQDGRRHRRVRAPRDEVRLAVVGIAVEEEVVLVARVAVPVRDEHLGGPERDELLDVHHLLQLEEQHVVFGRQCFDQRVDLGRLAVLLVGFLFERVAPLRHEVGERAFVEVAVVVVEPARHEALRDRLHVRIDAAIDAVDRHVREAATRRENAGRLKDGVCEAAAHVRRILRHVVERQLVEAVEIEFAEVVEVELEARLHLRQRAEEALLLDVDALIHVIVDDHRRFVLVERRRKRLIDTARLEDVHERSRLLGQKLEVARIHLDDDFHDVIGDECERREIGAILFALAFAFTFAFTFTRCIRRRRARRRDRESEQDDDEAHLQG
jgi:hypothetical protein